MTRIVFGSAALAAVGRVYAATPASSAVAAGAASSCGACEFYTATPGDSKGTCAFAGGKTVAADDGCGAYVQRQTPGAG